MINRNLMDWLPEGEIFLKQHCPELHRLMCPGPETRHTADVNFLSMAKPGSDEPDQGVQTGFQDNLQIRNISLDKNNRCLYSHSIAGFKEKKEVIAIVSEMFDCATGKSVKGAAVTDNNTCSLSCEINADFSAGKPEISRVLVKTTFYWMETDEKGKMVMKSYEERRDSGVLYDEGSDIIGNITVTFPNTLKLRNETIVLYARSAEYNKEDPDKAYPNVKAVGNCLPFHMPFIGSVRVNKGKIVGVDKQESVISVEHPEKHTMVTFNKDKQAHWADIRWRYLENNTVLQWTFPEDWKNNFDLKDLSVSSIFDFYACLHVKVILPGFTEPISVPVYMGSDMESDSTHCKIKKLFLMWGCLGKDTLIQLADGSVLRISDIKKGDAVVSGGGVARIEEMYTGDEKEMIRLITENDKELLLTCGHPVLTERGWVRAGEMNASDRVIVGGGGMESLKALYPLFYNDRVYSLKLVGGEQQLVANGIIVGDFVRQNQTMKKERRNGENNLQDSAVAAEFRKLIQEINRNKGWE